MTPKIKSEQSRTARLYNKTMNKLYKKKKQLKQLSSQLSGRPKFPHDQPYVCVCVCVCVCRFSSMWLKLGRLNSLSLLVGSSSLLLGFDSFVGDRLRRVLILTSHVLILNTVEQFFLFCLRQLILLLALDMVHRV